jgi:hypothetical protein
MKSLSFRDVKRRMVIKRKVEYEPEGITKEPTFLFMKVACSMVKVVI